MAKELVVYFSPTGTTKRKALELSRSKNIDICEIEPEVKYTKADLNWMNEKSRARVEMQDMSSRPKIKEINVHIENYDKIYIGFPIWLHIAPTIINTFLEKYNFSNKEIICFATSALDGWGNTLKNLISSVDKSCKISLGEIDIYRKSLINKY